MKPQPPKRALRFLRWFCREDYLEEFEGDLIELFEQLHAESPKSARRKFFWGVLRCFRPGFIKAFYQVKYSITTAMFKHNLLITLRNFKRYKSSFLINLTGLSVGLLSALLIYFWVYSEVTVDAFHEKDEQLYQVMRYSDYGQGIRVHDNNSDLLVPALKAEIAEIEYAALYVEVWSEVYLSLGEKKIKADGMLAGEDFFKIFSYNLVQGDRDRALVDQNSIVLSKKMAESLSADQEVELGKVVSILGETEYGARYAGDYVVTGIVDLSTQNVSERFDFLLTEKLFLNKRSEGNGKWNSNSSRTYVTLHKDTDVEQFSEKLAAFFRNKRYPDNSTKSPEWGEHMFLEKYSKRYLYNRYENGVQSGGRIDYIILFSAIGLMVLLVACINFMNLSTAQAFRRLKEVGVKKVVGASRPMLALQHITESVILAGMASLMAVFGAIALYPKLSIISGRDILVNWTPELVLGILSIVLITGLIAGSYPAFFISRLRPIQILKGKLKTSVSEVVVRKGLVVFQFCVSLILIVTVMVVTKQIEYTQSKNLGYERDNVLTFPMEGKLLENQEAFLVEAKKIVGIQNATMLEGSAANFRNSGGGRPRKGMPSISFTFARVGYDYVETLGIEMLEGRSFSRDFANEESKIILNETSVKAMGLENPIGKTYDIRGKREVIGIMKDFHFQSFHQEIKPSFLILVPEDANTIAVKVQAGLERETLIELEELYHTFNPNLPFEYKFLDQDYEELYGAEQSTAKLYKYFALVAIFISCLGLLGLAAFTVQTRLKEIGIRKVLGSNVWRIISLLSRDLTQTVVIALVISMPIGYYLTQQWLDGFAYRIDLTSGIFITSGAVVVLLAWSIVALQAMRAAKANPVECLKDE
ncbi:ABC transporter permease [Roseivirga sp. E12]|uniref:ABC transporter permease n=1 Tax=Roseivirga sp. E12 TaxID=2819237 RepID=UPI001ABCDE6F|nr:ABC transporter permease [Roseivirga sp. E12]MBO3698088.1 ABC transporter permease [Roseivirga sp. E12]